MNRFLLAAGGLDIHRGAVVGYVVASECRYFDPVAYPDAALETILAAPEGAGRGP